MSRLCDLASTVTAVDHPLCLDCAAQLKDEVQKQLEELESEIAAYSEAVKRLEAEAPVEAPQVGLCDTVSHLGRHLVIIALYKSSLSILRGNTQHGFVCGPPGICTACSIAGFCASRPPASAAK